MNYLLNVGLGSTVYRPVPASWSSRSAVKTFSSTESATEHQGTHSLPLAALYTQETPFTGEPDTDWRVRLLAVCQLAIIKHMVKICYSQLSQLKNVSSLQKCSGLPPSGTRNNKSMIRQDIYITQRSAYWLPQRYVLHDYRAMRKSPTEFYRR